MDFMLQLTETPAGGEASSLLPLAFGLAFALLCVWMWSLSRRRIRAATEELARGAQSFSGATVDLPEPLRASLDKLLARAEAKADTLRVTSDGVEQSLTRDLSAALAALDQADETDALDALRAGDMAQADAALGRLIASALEYDGGPEAEKKARMAALFRARGALSFISDGRDCIAHYGRAADIDPGDAATLNMLGVLQAQIGDMNGAARSFQRILTLPASGETVFWAALAIGNKALAHQAMGDLGAAKALFRRARDFEEGLGRKGGVSKHLGNLGTVSFLEGDLAGAQALYRQALDIEAKLVGRNDAVAGLCANLGNALAAGGDMKAACAHWKKAHDLFEQEGMSAEAERVARDMREAGCQAG